MRRHLAILFVVGCSTNVGAQTLSGDAPKAEKQERCVDVSIGGDNAYGCINALLKGEVDKVSPPIGNVHPIDARSSDLKVGTVNTPAVQQQYGRNFGVSVIPYRPPPLIYSAPLGKR